MTPAFLGALMTPAFGGAYPIPYLPVLTSKLRMEWHPHLRHSCANPAGRHGPDGTGWWSTYPLRSTRCEARATATSVGCLWWVSFGPDNRTGLARYLMPSGDLPPDADTDSCGVAESWYYSGLWARYTTAGRMTWLAWPVSRCRSH
jgi:hypothetical protein